MLTELPRWLEKLVTEDNEELVLRWANEVYSTAFKAGSAAVAKIIMKDGHTRECDPANCDISGEDYRLLHGN